MRARLHSAVRVREELPRGQYFGPPRPHPAGVPLPSAPSVQRLFGWVELPLVDTPPDWVRNVLTGQRADLSRLGWWEIGDFESDVGDVKGVWEPSRLGWAVGFAQQAVAGDPDALRRLNGWLESWCEANPAYLGLNWKCGQEASIRVIHLAMTAVILGQIATPSASLRQLVRAHLRRIAPTVSYAIGQDNNHGTSEAAALFIGGSWLASQGDQHGARWARRGRALLENRVAKLVAADGSFSQHSTNYHRLLLDTLSAAEVWRRMISEAEFSKGFCTSASRAVGWLHTFAAGSNGEGPNLGHNDGARLLPLGDADVRDLRASVQLGSALFNGARAIAELGPWDDALTWLRVHEHSTSTLPRATALFNDGGYAVLVQPRCTVMMRFPRFRFRPSHADALHVDLWVDGENHLPDAGTYSYNADARWVAYFPGTASHNTIQFDSHDQMPRVGRFLFANWLETDHLEPVAEHEGALSFAAGYTDAYGASHRRVIRVRPGRLTVEDAVSGSFRVATIRWRLSPGNWKVDAGGAEDAERRLSVRVNSTVDIERPRLVQGFQSTYYGRMTAAPVLEVDMHAPGAITTNYSWV